MGKKFLEFVVVLLFLIAVIAISALISGTVVKLLWNWLMPQLFGLPEITFWQAYGLSFFCSLLFKSVSPSRKNSE